MKLAIAMLLAAVTLPLSVAACGAGDPAGSSAAAQPAGPAQAAGTQEPVDQTLRLGERAAAPFVDYGNNERPTKVAVSVLDVRKGQIADLKDFDLDRKQRHSIPYYIDAKFKNLGDFTVSRHLLRASVEDTNAREYRPATLIVLGGTFKPCPQGRETKLAPAGFTDCAAVLLPQRTELRARALPGRRHHRPAVLAPQVSERTSMTRLTRTTIAAALALACLPASIAGAEPPEPTVPPDIAVPDGNKLFLVGDAVGVQIYTCNATVDGGYRWNFNGPRANVYGDNGKLLMSHYAGPRWASHGRQHRARQHGQERHRRPERDPLAQTVGHRHPRPRRRPADRHHLHPAHQHHRRPHPPADECNAHTAGNVNEVPYTADYAFWKADRG